MNSYSGFIQNGSRHATALGFPTLNIPLNDPDLSGIYAGEVALCGTLHAAALYADQERNILEAHLLDFGGAFKSGEITITPLKKIRDKETFASFKQLQAAIKNDIIEIKRFFEKNGSPKK